MSLLHYPNDTTELLHRHLDELAKPDVDGIDLGIKELQGYLLPLMAGDLGIILSRPGNGKCLCADTNIVMYDGTLKAIQDIVVGDRLMGPDSKPRNVLAITSGEDYLYTVKQNKGIDYTVNSHHILSLKRSRNEGSGRHGEVKNINVVDAYENQKSLNDIWKGYKVAIDFPEQNLEIPPYILGVWLGDGYASDTRITNRDSEIILELQKYAESIGQNAYVKKYVDKDCYDISITGSAGDFVPIKDRFTAKLQGLSLIRNKHIPQQYLANTRENRLELLAGLLDTDGYMQYDSYEIMQVRESLARQIKFLADSLGFRTSIRIDVADGKNYYRVRIGGSVDAIPTRVAYKKAHPKNIKDPSMTGFTIEEAGWGKYYGVEIDGDNLMLLEDMTVTHNSSLLSHLIRVASEDAINNTDKYAPPLFVSNEMPMEELQLRQLSWYTNIDTRDLRFGKSKNDWKALHNKINDIEADYPIIYVASSLYAGGKRGIITMELVEAAVDNIIETYGHPPRMIAIDYLQRMHVKNKSLDRRLALNEVIERAKDLALFHGIPVVIGSQASREVDTEKFPVPDLRHGKETGGIEEAADWVISGFRPSKYYKVGETIPNSDKNIIVTPELYFIRVLKQRSGEAGNGAWCSFDMRVSFLSDLEIEYFQNTETV